MKYQEKLQYANEVVLELKKGSTMESLRAMLKEQNLYDGEIDQVMTSAKNIMEEEYGDQVLTHLKNGTLEANKHEFSHLENEVMESLLFRAKNRIKSDVNKVVKQLADEGLSDKEIIEKMSSDIVTKEEVATMVNNFREYEELPKGPEKNKFIFLGIGIIVLGAILTFYSMSAGGRGRLGMGIIVFGFFYLLKAFSSKGTQDAYK